jgi:large subunit ribosomal protein L10
VNRLAITKQKKQELVETYAEHLANSHAIVLADYRGLTVSQMQALRRQMRQQDTVVQVTKNTLLKIALEQAGMPVPEELLVGPTAIAYLPEDVATAAKALFDFAKDQEALSIKGAMLEGQVLDAEAAKDLRNLPSRATVLAELLGILQGPASELVHILEAPAGELYRTLQAPLRELAQTIQAYADKGAQASA